MLVLLLWHECHFGGAFLIERETNEKIYKYNRERTTEIPEGFSRNSARNANDNWGVNDQCYGLS